MQMRIHTYTYMFIYSQVTTLHVCKHHWNPIQSKHITHTYVRIFQYMCMYIFTYIFVYMHKYTLQCIHTNINISVPIYIHMCMITFIQSHMYVPVSIFSLRMYFDIQINVYICVFENIWTFTCSQVMALHVRKQYYNPMFGRDAMDQVCIHTYVDKFICIHVFVPIYSFACANLYVYTYIYIYIYIYT